MKTVQGAILTEKMKSSSSSSMVSLRDGFMIRTAKVSSDPNFSLTRNRSRA